MNPATGESKVVVIVPAKSPKGTLNGTVVLDNGVGLATTAFFDVAVVNLDTGTITDLWNVPSDLLTNSVYKTTKMVFRRIPHGTFTMGSPSSELGRDSFNETQHQVTLTRDFYIGVFEVTQAQYMAVMGNNPSYYTGDSRPAESVEWNTARGGTWPSGSPAASSFMGKLQTLTDGYAFDLPTEAQWEYACRAGTTTALNSGKNLISVATCSNMDEVGWYYYNSFSDKHHEVGTKAGSYAANAWGLYDMHGNVSEYCLDWGGGGDYGGNQIDPVGPSTGFYLTFRTCGTVFSPDLLSRKNLAFNNLRRFDISLLGGLLYAVGGFR